MQTRDIVDLFFGGLEKLGPGDNADIARVLRLLPELRSRVVVDAGCGTGRQTLVLARELGASIHAIDCHQPFLDELERRAREASLERLVQTHCMDMSDISRVFFHIDLLWSEGAAYNIGFTNALRSWATSVTAGGFAVVSELSWLKKNVPDDVGRFFGSAYPDMKSVEGNIASAEDGGYELLAVHTLPRQAWIDGYYDVLGPRARTLLDHPDPAVRDFAASTLEEIRIFDRSEDSYGYVFYVLQRR